MYAVCTAGISLAWHWTRPAGCSHLAGGTTGAPACGPRPPYASLHWSQHFQVATPPYTGPSTVRWPLVPPYTGLSQVDDCSLLHLCGFARLGSLF